MDTTLLESESLLYQRLRAVTVDVLDLDAEQVSPASNFADDLGLDSLDLVELVEALEAEFGVRIEDAELADITTLAEAYHLLAAKTA